LVVITSRAQVIIDQKTFQSKILHQSISYSVCLPGGYKINNEYYPVVYLLHGLDGDRNSWIDYFKIYNMIDSLRKTNTIHNFILVMPDAKNGYYINNYNKSFRYEDFFIDEFIPYIDSIYRTIPLKGCRVLAGISMGGFGAIILAVKHPKLFGSVIEMSGSIRTVKEFENLPQERYEQYFANVFGPKLSGEERITLHWKSNSPYYLIDSVSAENMKSINWYIDCGMDDYLLPANEAFHQLLMQYKIPHEFHIRPGNHNWEYWHESIVHGLMFLAEYMNSDR
jgi:enterochelin esterase-like enzyme